MFICSENVIIKQFVSILVLSTRNEAKLGQVESKKEKKEKKGKRNEEGILA
jgi:hypothetical protein